MTHYVGLDVSMKTVSVCILDEKGQVCREVDLPTDPSQIHAFLVGTGFSIQKIGLEAGSLTHWLTQALRALGYEVHPMESRKMAAILASTINKTDKNDARGIAEALRAGHYTQCTHRSNEAMSRRTLLHSRDLLVRQRTQLTNSIRGFLKTYGIKLRKGRTDFVERVQEAIRDLPDCVQGSLSSLLSIVTSLSAEIQRMDQLVKEVNQADDRVALLKTIPGVGDIVALAYLSEIDDVARFQRSKDVGPYLGLTPRRYSSGEVNKQGRISKQGSHDLRLLLIEAAMTMLTRSQAWSPLKAWGMKLMRKKGAKKAIVAVARKLAIVMHSMLKHQKTFAFRSNEKKEAAA